MPDYIIKEISVADNLAIADELVGALHLSEYGFNKNTAQWADIRESYLQHITECQQECDGTFLVAMVGEEAIGFLFGYVEEKDNSNYEIGEGDDLYVSEGFVKSEFRKHGIYTALNTAFEEKYKNHNIRRIFRYTLCTNETMQRWLEKQGYKPIRMVYEKWIQ